VQPANVGFEESSGGHQAAIGPDAASAIFPLFGAGATQDGLRKVRFALDSALEGTGFEPLVEMAREPSEAG